MDAATVRFLNKLTACGFDSGPILDNRAVVYVGLNSVRLSLVVDWNDPSRIESVIHEGHRYTPDEATELLVA